MNISRKRLEEIQNIPDSAIDTSEIPELDDHFWENAKMVKPITKKAISIRLDDDILDWFKSHGVGWEQHYSLFRDIEALTGSIPWFWK